MSLLRIDLKNFVIVRHLELDFSPGFTVLTGETGAGKSILIDALQLVLGGRADASVIREGESKADVSAEFSIDLDDQVWLRQMDIDGVESSLLLRRTIDIQGRSRAWINGTPATASQLKELGSRLLDIHGQHAWQGLVKPEAARNLLDDYAGIDTGPLICLWNQWKQACDARAHAQSQAAQVQAQKEQLNWQIAELERLHPTEAGWAQLQEEHARLANVHTLMEGAEQVCSLLSEGHHNASDLMTKAHQALSQRLHIEPRFASALGNLDQIQLLMSETERELRVYSRHCDADPGRLEEVNQRLSLWLGLAKRHRCTPDGLPVLYLDWKRQLAELAEAAQLDALQAHEQRCEQALLQECKIISNKRHAGKQKLATEISLSMQQLGMPGGVFEVELTPLDSPQSGGLESVEFLVAGHPGVEPKPISKVASGGELSRIALAIAVTTSQLGGNPTLIFDEVDSGVGGAVAQTVGRLMSQLGRDRQVLAVTHLAQVAACADHHVKVAKVPDGSGVVSQVDVLTPPQREHEIARMIGGTDITAAALNHAREMLLS